MSPTFLIPMHINFTWGWRRESLMRTVEVPNEAVRELPDFYRHGNLLVLI